MHSIALKDGFGIDHLSLQSGPEPKPGKDEILVHMKAASLNYLDLLVINGRIAPQLLLPYIPVADGAGVVATAGENVEAFKPGDRVVTLYNPAWTGGRYGERHATFSNRPGTGTLPGQLTEYKIFRANEITLIPANLSFAEAATLPVAALTAWNALAYGGIKAGHTVLLHGTGGVSIFALQFAKMHGARVIITSSDDQKLERALGLHADFGINYRKQTDVPGEVLRLTDGEGADIVVETVGGPNLAQSLKALCFNGHISVVGLLAGMESTVNFMDLNRKRATIKGFSVGSTEDFRDMLAAIDANGLKPVIDSTFPLERAADAFRHLENGKHFGKIVIEIP